MEDNAQRPRPPLNRRRDKAQLSCHACRHRKLRCDRQHPCGACSRRGHPDSCNYAATSSTPDAQRTDSLHGRISELESLVVTLMQGQSLPTPPIAKSSTESSPLSADVFPEIRSSKQPQIEATTDPGTLQLRESGTSYVQSVHWEAVLTKIRGLKEESLPDPKGLPGSHLFYGPSRHATRDEIMAAIPPRSKADQLLAFHFDSHIITPYLIHRKKFLREYESFWTDPSATSTAWIGLMFAMLYIAAQLHVFELDFTDARSQWLKAEYSTLKDAFREKAMQCLILAKYTMGGPHILETLITVLTGEFVLMKDSATDGWLGISTILHIAVRMGYHRDPDHFPEITPFEGEMRRRIWTTILQIDLSLSLEMGLPRNATDSHIDTNEPRNLLDDDFEEDTIELPPSRPETEWTPVLPLITRARLISALGLICDVNTNISPPSTDEVLRADALLENVYNRAVPPLLRWKTTSQPITDSPNLVVQRISVETTYYKSRILLYRRALISHQIGQPQERDKASVRICLDSALKILSFQEMLHEESQQFGRLRQLRWKTIHLFRQDVLIATSVLCLYLQDADKFELSESAGQVARSSRAEEIRQRLAVAYKIWSEMSTTSVEAGKVARALSVVLGNAETFASNECGTASYDFPTDFDAIPVHEFGAMLNNQYIPSGFYSPLAFFDNVLETFAT